MDSRESMIRGVVAYAKGTTGPITVAAMERAGARLNHRSLYRLFPGGFAELLTAAGLATRIARVGRLGSNVLMEELHRVARELGHVPDWAELTRLGKYSARTYYLRFGRMRDVTAAYERWLGKRERMAAGEERREDAAKEDAERVEVGPEGKVGEGISTAHCAAGSSGSPDAEQIAGTEGVAAASCAGGSSESPEDGKRRREDYEAGELVGAPMGFRGLLHAPTTESGVIHLFGLMGPELGIAVETIGVAFPDCRGLRALPGSGGKWKRIAIEFELRSSNFKWHRHDPARCDVIVCWEHDWPDCPLEVIELKKELAKVGR